jgi:hypothetical protein
MIIPWVYFLKAEEQLLLESFTEKWTVNGPGTVLVKPFVKVRRRVGISLSPTEYVKIRDLLSGEIRIMKGPAFVFLQAYDELIKRYEVIVLQNNEYVKIIEKTSGKVRVVTGPCNVVLSATEEVIEGPGKGINIDEHNAVLIRSISDGSLKLITRNQVFFPAADEQIEEVRKRILLEDHESVIIKGKDGRYRIISGSQNENSFFLQPYESLLTMHWSSGIHKEKRELRITHIDTRPKFMWYEFA